MTSGLDRAWRWIAPKPARLVVAGGIAALVSSAGALLINYVAKDEMHWLEFGTSLLDKVLVGSLLGAVGAMVELRRKRDEAEADQRLMAGQQRREVRRISGAASLVATGWSPIPSLEQAHDSLSTEQEITIGQPLQEAAEDMKEFASQLDAAYSRDITDGEIILDPLTLRSGIERYLIEGGRQRRFLILEAMYSDLAAPLAREESETSFGAELARTRDAIGRVLVLRSHTDTVILERLLVERRFRPFGLPALNDQTRQLLTASRIDSAAVNHEPLYLLQSFVSAIAGPEVIVSPERLSERLDIIRRCIGALRNEVAQLASVLSCLMTLEIAANAESSS